MQLEETASSKDVPPLSTRGVFELPAFIAQNNMRPHCLAKVAAGGLKGSVEFTLCRRKILRSLA